MGRPKQLLKFNGVPLVRLAAVEALASGCGPVVVVCGAHAELVAEALTGLEKVQVAINQGWKEGISSSIHCGMRQLGEQPSRGVILTRADLALVDQNTYRRLTATHWGSGRAIVASRYSGDVGVPALFTREHFRALLELSSAQGCQDVILGNLSDSAIVDFPDGAADIDSEQDYVRILAEFARRRCRATPKFMRATA